MTINNKWMRVYVEHSEGYFSPLEIRGSFRDKLEFSKMLKQIKNG